MQKQKVLQTSVKNRSNLAPPEKPSPIEKSRWEPTEEDKTFLRSCNIAPD